MRLQTCASTRTPAMATPQAWTFFGQARLCSPCLVTPWPLVSPPPSSPLSAAQNSLQALARTTSTRYAAAVVLKFLPPPPVLLCGDGCVSCAPLAAALQCDTTLALAVPPPTCLRPLSFPDHQAVDLCRNPRKLIDMQKKVWVDVCVCVYALSPCNNNCTSYFFPLVPVSHLCCSRSLLPSGALGAALANEGAAV